MCKYTWPIKRFGFKFRHTVQQVKRKCSDETEENSSPHARHISHRGRAEFDPAVYAGWTHRPNYRWVPSRVTAMCFPCPVPSRQEAEDREHLNTVWNRTANCVKSRSSVCCTGSGGGVWAVGTDSWAIHHPQQINRPQSLKTRPPKRAERHLLIKPGRP